MRVLWAKAGKLLPVRNGGNIRSYHLLRQLALRHEVTVFSYYGEARDVAYEEALAEQFSGAVCLCTGASETPGWRRNLDYLLRLPAKAPYAVSRFSCEAVRRRLGQWYDARTYDVAVCDFLDAAVNFPARLAIPTVLFQHNVESEIWRRHAQMEGNKIRQFIYRMEFGKMRRYESECLRRFAHVIAVSEHDRGLMRAWVGESGVSVVPTGVDLQNFRCDPSVSATEPLVVFVGAMDWEPNVDAVGYFSREIWPAVRAKVPAARLRIVGRNPDLRIQRLASDSVHVTGEVASVVDHLRGAAVVVVPLRVGGGTRLKIYEAMAMGKAVVSTTVGAEGLDVHHGHDLLLADTPAAFATAVVALLQDRDLRRRYEQAAAALASQHDWAVVCRKFTEILAAVASGRHPAGGTQPLPGSGKNDEQTMQPSPADQPGEPMLSLTEPQAGEGRV